MTNKHTTIAPIYGIYMWQKKGRMRTAVYKYTGMKKCFIYSNDNNITRLLFVYKILYKSQITELTIYKDGSIDRSLELKAILDFDEKNPLETVNKFYQLLIVQD